MTGAKNRVRQLEEGLSATYDRSMVAVDGGGGRGYQESSVLRPCSVPTFPHLPRMEMFPGLERWHKGMAYAVRGTLSTRAPLNPGSLALADANIPPEALRHLALQRGRVTWGICPGAVAG